MLQKVAIKLFSMATSTAASERNFSTMGFIYLSSETAWPLIPKIGFFTSDCPTLLYWVNTDINSIILILQCLRCIVFRNLIQFYELNYLYQGASSRACPPILLATHRCTV
uniref:HAT C-terminal dimerisation domain-containing protein n=1 Tax=Hyaloperonospora arabidopsidis (strain Emoy2) TaxID=559515 RepID=M4B5F4_HYAAE